MNRPTDIFENPGGRRGIRTPGTRNSYGSLANCWFQPLTHPSRVRYRIAKHCLSNAGAKLAIYFRPAKFIGIFFSKILLKSTEQLKMSYLWIVHLNRGNDLAIVPTSSLYISLPCLSNNSVTIAKINLKSEK